MKVRERLIEPGAVRKIAPPRRVEDLHPGLILFFARPSMLQTWAEMFGHEWRHVGVMVQTEHGMRVASYGPKKCFRLDDPAEIMGAYSRVGVAEIFQTDAEIAQVTSFCRKFTHSQRADAPYAFSSMVLGPLHLSARRCAPGLLRTLLFQIVMLYCLIQRFRYRDRDAYVCSTFLWDIIDQVRDETLRTPLSAHPEDEAAYATESNARDELFARWLCGPTELWQAISPASRCELDLEALCTDVRTEAPNTESESELVIDLRENRGADARSPVDVVAPVTSRLRSPVAEMLRSSN